MRGSGGGGGVGVKGGGRPEPWEVQMSSIYKVKLMKLASDANQ